jgi:hypothetical protein
MWLVAKGKSTGGIIKTFMLLKLLLLSGSRASIDRHYSSTVSNFRQKNYSAEDEPRNGRLFYWNLASLAE